MILHILQFKDVIDRDTFCYGNKSLQSFAKGDRPLWLRLNDGDRLLHDPYQHFQTEKRQG
ncbi:MULTISPECIES: hypothetical protein [Cyanophyceae]|uniref:hypothetical protein n=1 Tax=Cyanophyceae TaxID=3028117 RepID=UPI0003160694|nr:MULTISPECIES: hypothetical protein [Cyanophyceae]